MLSLLKLCLLFVGLASAGTAIGIPLALHAQGKLRSDAKDLVQAGQSGGGGSERISLELTKCGEGRGVHDLTSFGISNHGSYCWKIKDKDLSRSQDHSKLTDLFTKMWGKDAEGKNWHMTSGTSWQISCLGEGKDGWIIFGEGDGREWLGYCDNSKDSKETSFLSVNQSNSKVDRIKYCEKDCWKDSADSQKPQQLSERDESKWFDVEFYKNQKK